ncbi:MAG: TetR/AcrR family transcriptional regulator [Aquidulcibacter sp.]|jgi:AcrR family transcriptional regulator|uniref:TetR/AcrR family transcriptional regulator n=1 Tax=Aquidulcibacter sp. TaxID=2052990 RepID=UPI0022BDE476|nr:TetR/AcrR family transcriptional regulator [Aquidulcibacter sp.]MCE2890684.1 TetR/AcrR family transcriptional regulator [Hyphomonadaceae bacterium]MCZ8209144.1 TetR/AcrR family transcriptional regulator [Aquidulcibacter sp.]
MASATILNIRFPSDPPSDGRRARSQTSRDKIVSALLQLVEGGDLSPSAARVAEVAGVGLRSVFRHFDDMETLYQEVSERVSAEVMPLLDEPVTGAVWKERLMNVVERRATIFERIHPFRLSTSFKRFHSAFLTEEYRRTLQLEASTVEALLPEHILVDNLSTRSIKVVLSFQNWHALRFEQDLSIQEARDVVTRLLGDILSRLTD